MQAYISISMLPLSLLLVLLGSVLDPAYAADDANVNGIPACANACALSFISTQNCPLTTQKCICAYLSYYDTCVAQSCNSTDSVKAIAPPIPYYIPDLTISIASASGTAGCAATGATNPVFGTSTSPRAAETTAETTSEAREGGETSVTRETSSASGTTLASTSASKLTKSSSTGASSTQPLSASTSTQTEVRTTSMLATTTTSTASAGPARVTNSSGAKGLKLRFSIVESSTWAFAVVLGLSLFHS